MELFRLAANERRAAVRQTAKYWLVKCRTIYAPGFNANDIPIGCTKPWAPAGRIQSQMTENAISGNAVLECQCFDTMLNWDGEAARYDYYWGERVSVYNRAICAWALRDGSANVRALLANGQYAPSGIGASSVHTYKVGIWSDESIETGRILAYGDTDWRGNSPPDYGHDRMRPHDPINSRLLTETWLLVNKLHCPAWISDISVDGGLFGDDDTGWWRHDWVGNLWGDSAVSETQAKTTCESVIRGAGRTGVEARTKLTAGWTATRKDVTTWRARFDEVLFRAANVFKHPGVADLLASIYSVVPFRTLHRWEKTLGGGIGYITPRHRLRGAIFSSEPTLANMQNDMSGAGWKKVLGLGGAEHEGVTYSWLEGYAEWGLDGISPTGIPASASVWLAHYFKIDASESGMPSNWDRVDDDGLFEFYFSSGDDWEGNNHPGWNLLALDCNFTHFDRDALYA